MATAVWLAGCAEPTQLVVYVWTDMSVPLDVDQVRVRVYTLGDPSPSYDNTVPLPESGRMDFRTELSFGAGPRGEDTTRRVRVLVDAIKGGDTLFTTEVRTGFARRKKLRLDVYLARRCLTQAAMCLPDQTCGLEGCVSPDVPVEALPPADVPPTSPRDPRTADAGGLDDAGVGTDSGDALDGSAPDAGTPPVDTGTPPADGGAPVVDGAAVPSPTRQLAPLSSSRFPTRDVVLEWEAPPPGTSVEYVVNHLDGGTLARFASTGSSVTLMSVTAGAYTWQVRSSGPGGTSAWSPWWKFVVADAPGAASQAWGTYPDVNGDGLGDLVIAAPAAAGRPGSAQLASFTSAPARGLSAAVATATLTDPTSRTLAIACAGDVNGDGFVDVLVGSPETEATRGVVDVFYGSSAGLGAAPDATLRPMGMGELFGASVASAGDVDADGYADVVVGAPDAGVAYVFRGGAGGLGLAWRDRIPAPVGTNGAGSFGAAVAGTDVDADGDGDVIVGSPSAYAARGAVHVYRSNRAGLDPPETLADPTGGTMATGFGALLASGDLTGGGVGEVAVLRSLGSSAAITVAQARTAGTLTTGPTFPVATTTTALAAAGNFAADDRHDLALGAARYLLDRGTVEVVDLVGTILPIRDGTAGQLLGASVAYLGDVDGDGRDDLAYAVPGAGQVFVHYGPLEAPPRTATRIVPGGAYSTPSMRIAGAQ